MIGRWLIGIAAAALCCTVAACGSQGAALSVVTGTPIASRTPIASYTAASRAASGAAEAVPTTTRSDRVAGFDEVAKRYQVLQLVAPSPTKPSLTFQRLQASAPHLTVTPGEAVQLGDGATLDLLYSSPQAAAITASQPATVWRLRQGQTSVLFAGALPPADWPALGHVEDTLVESASLPTGGQTWIRPVTAASGTNDDAPAIDLSSTGSLAVHFTGSDGTFEVQS